MTDTAQTSSVPSQEPLVRGGSNPFSFDDMGNLPKPEPKAKPEPKPEPKEKPEAKASAPERRQKADDVADKEKKEPRKAEAKESIKDEAEADEKDAKAEKKEGKPKAKVHKVRSGESVIDLSGDSVFTIEVDGKKEEVTLEDLRANYSGKTDWSRKYGDLGKEKAEFQKTRQAMDDMVTGLMTKAKEDPNEGFDFLADLTGQDPVSFKMDLIKKQIEELLPIAQMSEEEREAWLKDKERDFRDRKYERKERAEKEAKTKAQQKADIDTVRERYGIDEETYAQAEKQLRDYFRDTNQKGSGPNGEITPRDVVIAQRYAVVFDVVEESLPHLVDSPKSAMIMNEAARLMADHPQISREKIAQILVEEFGSDDDKAGLKALGKKAREQAQASGDELPVRKTPAKREAVFFDDL